MTESEETSERVRLTILRLLMAEPSRFMMEEEEEEEEEETSAAVSTAVVAEEEEEEDCLAVLAVQAVAAA